MPRNSGETPYLGALDAKSASRLLRASNDIALVMDHEGTILEVVTQMVDAAAQQAQHWRGRPWVRTVTTESRHKVEALLHDAQAAADAEIGRSRQINQVIANGEQLPLLFSAVRLGDSRTPVRGKPRVLALGRDLRAMAVLQRRLIDAQQSMERDHWRSREAETRYRQLLETSSEAVLIVDGNSQKILEANPAARALCGSARPKLVGAALSSLFDPSHGERLQDLLAAARSGGRKDAVRARLAEGQGEVQVSASVFRQEDTVLVLVRLSPMAATGTGSKAGGTRRTLVTAGPSWESRLTAFVQNAPDGLVFCDGTGRVTMANRAFLALVEVSTEDQARGQALDRWLGRTGVEFGVLITNLRQRGTVSRFVTALRGEYGNVVEVEISAVQLPPGGETVLAFTIREIERRLDPEADGGRAMTRSASELTDLVGRTPLKDIISETTDVIEQLCIETALEMSNDNRASAALLLGLSRQSLYVKLRRYGLGNLGSDA